MSPASKSISKDKTAKAVKEQARASLKTISPGNIGNVVPASAYNPLSGTFHTLEIAPSAPLSPPQTNSRFQTIDETEEHSGSSLGTAAEYDSFSNNDSCSVESEDQKEKASTQRTEVIPGADTEKRDKIRQKNERKHQRQKEKRSQELHERCSGYLMSRKLEMLAQNIVAMGFSSERATMALILNEGRVEESVLWLLEGGDESKQQSAASLDEANLKIDIADELAQIAALEIQYKCKRQEVERAVVACEGDLEKAEDSLKSLKHESASFPSRLEHPGEALARAFNNKLSFSAQNPAGKAQSNEVPPVTMKQHRRDQRDFNYTKAVVVGNTPVECNRNLQPLKKIQPKQEKVRPQVAHPLDKRWPNASPSSSASVPYSMPSPLQVAVPQAKLEARYAMGGQETNTNVQPAVLKEPIIMMQRPQSNSSKTSLLTAGIGFSASTPASTGLYPSGATSVDTMKMAAANGVGYQLRNLNQNVPPEQFYQQNPYQQFVSSPMESSIPGRAGAGSWSNAGAPRSTSLAVPSSLGLFTGWGSTGSSSGSSLDWSSGGSKVQCDYTTVDWSLDATPLSLNGSKFNDMWSTASLGVKYSRQSAYGGVGLHDGSHVADTSPSLGSHEWTSPFNGEDLFRAPRRFVTSPSL